MCFCTIHWLSYIIFVLILFLLLLAVQIIDRGKAIVSDVALEIGISADLLAATLAVFQDDF